MSTFKKCRVVLVPIDEEGDVGKTMIYKKVQNTFGNSILDPILEMSTNKTFIRNTLLMNTGAAATNSKTRCMLFHMYVLSQDKIEDQDWWMYIDLEQRPLFPVKEDKASRKVQSDEKDMKIIASTDPNLKIASPSKGFIEKFCELGGIDEIMVEYDCLTSVRMGIMDLSKNPSWKQTSDSKCIESRPKVDNQNTITIKKFKDEFSREEVDKLIEDAMNVYAFCGDSDRPRSEAEFNKDLTKFKAENL